MAKLLRTRVRRGRNPIFKCRTTIFNFKKVLTEGLLNIYCDILFAMPLRRVRQAIGRRTEFVLVLREGVRV